MSEHWQLSLPLFEVENLTGCKKIALTCGQCALVDEADYDYLIQWKWYAYWCIRLKAFYAARSIKVDGQSVSIRMHRQLMGLERGDKRVVDHINHKTLDNRRSNLRICTQAQNMWNIQNLRADNVSGCAGVSWSGSRQKWMVQFRAGNGKRYFGGRFNLREEAILAYRALVAVRGEFNYRESAA